MRASAMPQVIAAVLVLFCWLRPAAAAEILVLSDIHFDPTANAALVDRLAQAPARQWKTILASDRSRMSGYGADTDWKLLHAALAAMKAQPKPALVLMTGDFLVHRFRARFDAAARDHSDAAFRAFAVKTMRFLALELGSTFPKTPILPVLGNNDDFCGDYALRPGGAFVADTADIAAALIGHDAGATFQRSWRALGNYVVPNPVVTNALIVAVDTNFLSRNYRNACGGNTDSNAATATLAWLGNTLREAASARRKVWLIYHIPPGIDAYASARRNSCPLAPITMFTASAARRFHALMTRYRTTITASFAGHIHMDSFQLLADGKKPFGFVLINPALSPIFGQNPAFRRLAIAKNGSIANETVYYLANLKTAAAGAAAQWRAEASFDTAWHAPAVDLRSLETLYRRIGTSPATRKRWLSTYAVQGASARQAVNPANLPIYRCALGHDRAADVARCACGRAAP